MRARHPASRSAIASSIRATAKASAARERLGGRHEAVAVGVRLDDRDDATAGGEFANPREVVPERCRVDDSAQRRAQNAPSP